MKTLLLVFCLVLFGALNSSSQTYSLEIIHQDNAHSGLDGLFFAEGKIWASTGAGPIYFDGSNWHFANQPNGTQTGDPFCGIKKNNGSFFVCHSFHNKSYFFNEADMTFDYVYNGIYGVANSFVFSDKQVYLPTSKKKDSDNKAHIHLWDVEAGTFNSIISKSNTNFNSVYVKSPENILILSKENPGSSRQLLRYNGNNLELVYQFENNISVLCNFFSLNGEDFLIYSAYEIYSWSESTGIMTKISDQLNIITDAVSPDMENIFLSGPEGIYHLKASTGEINQLYDAGPTSSAYDKYTNRIIFSFSSGGILELKGLSSINRIDLSAEAMVYPNPVSNQLNIDFSVDGEKSIEVYNLLGQKLISTPMGREKNVQIDASQLLPGTYIVKMYAPKGVFAIKKFIKIP